MERMLAMVGEVVGDQIMSNGFTTSANQFTYGDAFLFAWLGKSAFNPVHQAAVAEIVAKHPWASKFWTAHCTGALADHIKNRPVAFV